MFVRKLRISSALLPDPQELNSFAWRKVLAIASVLGLLAFSLWIRYALWGVLKDQTTEDSGLAGDLKDDIDEESSRFQRITNDSIEQAATPTYCRITPCNAVSCSSIPRNIDPGTVASKFIESDFKFQCENFQSVALSFDSCVFPGNTLRKDWLRTSVSIEELTFSSCSLREIEDDAFLSSIYDQTRKVTMINNNLAALRASMFRHLNKLQGLVIQRNLIKSAEFNLLEPLASSLTSLELDEAIDDREVLRNITGTPDGLWNLQMLSLRGNSIPVIDAQLFTGVSAVKSLYLDNSKVKTVSDDVLKPMISSIVQMMLNDNNIASLPEGLANSLLNAVDYHANFKLGIHNNPWRCECDLKWMQDLIRSHLSMLVQIPTCKTPQINAGMSFTTAEFCYPTSSTVTVTTPRHTKPDSTEPDKTTTPMPTTIKETVEVTCTSAYDRLSTVGSRKLLSADTLPFQSRFPNFSISNVHDESLLVQLPDMDDGVTLFWFSNDDTNRSLSCVKNVNSSYLVRNIDPDTTYTICLLNDNEGTASPLNCLAATTNPTYGARTWLTNSDKSLVFIACALSVILLLIVGGVLSFLTVMRHPKLLRGNKRVMVVKHRNVDAIVLPRGVDMNDEKQGRENEAPYESKSQTDGYVVPLPPARKSLTPMSRRSEMSLHSDEHSYVSEIEPTESQLDSWRLLRMKSDLEKEKSVAPPLPPHPSDAIPSLSLAVDTKDELDYQMFTV
ncbi:uncharacterized protein LOC143425414 [Xylocopa sonorina]|uniref:uncharacterized protein LOC143425414 n=1 Tax=Xylocopa sonorina TaxID=1818115 RepID=UPI00403AFAEF